jgi:hypothetical protein
MWYCLQNQSLPPLLIQLKDQMYLVVLSFGMEISTLLKPYKVQCKFYVVLCFWIGVPTVIWLISMLILYTEAVTWNLEALHLLSCERAISLFPLSTVLHGCSLNVSSIDKLLSTYHLFLNSSGMTTYTSTNVLPWHNNTTSSIAIFCR